MAKYRCNPLTGPDRFWSKVKKHDAEHCWNWIGHVSKSGGTGHIFIADKNWSAPRYSWLLHNGQIPDGMCVCHHCDNRRCVNPSHLFLGTKKDNSQDMVHKKRQYKQPVTHCPKGHPYDEVNTKIYQGRRYCRRCKYLQQRDARLAGPLGVYSADKTHCPKGHPYDSVNTYVDSNNSRHCLACARESQRARRLNQ